MQPQHFARAGRANPTATGASRGRGAARRGTMDAMAIPGIQIETLHDPRHYTPAQIERATLVARMLNRGKLVLVEPPAKSS